MKISRLAVAGASAIAVMAASSASAATYAKTLSGVDPASLTCTRSGNIVNCARVTIFASSDFIFLNSGDQYTLEVDYSHALIVPGSATRDIALAGLFDYNVVRGGRVPLFEADVSTTLLGYVGPLPIGYSSYHSISYLGTAGFGFGSLGLPNAGFSLTGIKTVMSITQSDPNIILGAVYGYNYAVPEPSAWMLMIMGFGAVGGVLRLGRRKPDLAGV